MQSVNGSEIDVRLLVQWVGSDGAEAALTRSRRCSVKALRNIAEGLGCTLTKDVDRQALIAEIVRTASKRIDKPLEDLFHLNCEELIDYFTRIEVESRELLDLLKEMEIQPPREGLPSLIKFTAQQLSETGRFMRIASSSRRYSARPVE